MSLADQKYSNSFVVEDAERMRAALKTVLPSYDAAIRTLAAEQMHDLAEQMPPLTSQITLPTERG